MQLAGQRNYLMIKGLTGRGVRLWDVSDRDAKVLGVGARVRFLSFLLRPERILLTSALSAKACLMSGALRPRHFPHLRRYFQ